MAVFCVVSHHFLSSASSSLRYPWLHAWSWKPFRTSPYLHAPYPSPLPMLPPRETFQCVLFSIRLFTVISGCVILSVLRKALRYKTEMLFSSSSFPLFQRRLPKVCSGCSSWTAPQWWWADQIDMRKRHASLPPPWYKNHLRKAFFLLFFKDKTESTPLQPMVLNEPMLWFGSWLG